MRRAGMPPRGGARRRTAWVSASAVAAVLLLCVPPARTAERKFWTVRAQRELKDGDLRGVSLPDGGGVTLGPAIRKLERLEEAFLWSLAPDGAGGFFLGTGSEARVYHFDRDGNRTLAADLEGDQVFALASGPSGTLFAATSPSGKIFEIRRGVSPEVYFEPGAKYIWSLAWDTAHGVLYAGTGEEGKIYAVTARGKGEEFFATGELHVTSLAVDPEGNVFAGTVEHGYVFRIDRTARKGRVVYDSGLQEIRALRSSPDGVVYVVASDGPSFAALKKEEGKEDLTKDASKLGDAFFTGGAAARGELVAVFPDGRLDKLQGTDGTMIMDARIGDDGRPYFVTMEALLVGHGREHSDVLFFGKEALITALCPLGSDRYAFAASMQGAVYLVLPGAAEGEFVSAVKDASSTVNWGILKAEVRPVPGAGVQFFARTGNTESPDKFWADWKGPYADFRATPLDLPPGRFGQVKTVLKPAADGTAPYVESISLSYIEQNRPPVVRGVRVHPPGVMFGEGDSKDTSSFEDDEQEGGLFVTMEVGSSPESKDHGKKKIKKGVRTVTWEAEDPDGDVLTFDVRVKLVDGPAWFLVRRGVRDDNFTFDATALPDGYYRVRLTADDRTSNPSDIARTDERESDRFLVDNTAPVVGSVLVDQDGAGVKVRFQATDAMGSVVRADYSVDGARWARVLPRDGVGDQPQELFEIRLGAVEKGPHLIALRVVDDSGNAGLRSLDVVAPVGKL